jgi:hypothetical protein
MPSKKTPAQLDYEIAEVLRRKPNPTHVGGPDFLGLDEFDLEWKRQEKQGRADSLGGAEYRRVKGGPDFLGLDEFDLEWKRQEKRGRADSLGGAEYRRVKGEWISAGRPIYAIEAFIHRGVAAPPVSARVLPDLHVRGGRTGIRTSQLTEPVRVGRMTVSGKGSVGIDLDDDDD